MIDPLLLSVTKVSTFSREQPLTNASGFFFSRDDRLFVVTSRHVLWDDTSDHYPDTISIELHTDEENVAQAVCRVHPFAVDVSSGVESAKGIKEATKMADFIREVNPVPYRRR